MTPPGYLPPEEVTLSNYNIAIMKKSKKEYPYYFKEGNQEFVTYLLYGGIECTMSVDNAKGVGY